MRGVLNKPDLKTFLFFIFVLNSIFILCYTGAVGDSFGMSPMALFIMIAAMLLLSVIEIPVYSIRTKKPDYTWKEVELLEKIYTVPLSEELQSKEIVYNSKITLNVGGFILPLAMAIYLLSINPKLEILIMLLIMVIVTHLLSDIKNGIGVVVPGYVSLLAASIGLILLENAAPVVFIVGVFGILLGTFTRLLTIEDNEGSAFFNMGGVGSFNAVYITVILSVLLSII